MTMWVTVLEKVTQSGWIRKWHHFNVIQPLKIGEDNTCNITLQQYSKIRYDNGKKDGILSNLVTTFWGWS